MRWSYRFTLQRISLFNAETMLLINNNQTKIVKVNALTQKCVGANHNSCST